MLALATHEPHFRVLREDVFSQSGSNTACRICGEEGHYAAQCTGVKPDSPINIKKPAEKKPFIFLDVAVLREYLEATLPLLGSRTLPGTLRGILPPLVATVLVGNPRTAARRATPRLSPRAPFRLTKRSLSRPALSPPTLRRESSLAPRLRTAPRPTLASVVRPLRVRTLRLALE